MNINKLEYIYTLQVLSFWESTLMSYYIRNLICCFLYVCSHRLNYLKIYILWTLFRPYQGHYTFTYIRIYIKTHGTMLEQDRETFLLWKGGFEVCQILLLFHCPSP